jgi:hypothetical protein
MAAIFTALSLIDTRFLSFLVAADSCSVDALPVAAVSFTAAAEASLRSLITTGENGSVIGIFSFQNECRGNFYQDTTKSNIGSTPTEKTDNSRRRQNQINS